MAKADNVTNAARYQELKAGIMKSTGLEEGIRLNFLLACAMRLERLSADILLGKDINPADLVTLQTAVTEMSPMPKHELRVEIVHPSDHTCVRCHTEMSDDDLALAKARIAHRHADGRDRPRTPSQPATEAPQIATAPKPPTPAPSAPRSIHDLAEKAGMVKSDDDGTGSLCWRGSAVKYGY